MKGKLARLVADRAGEAFVQTSMSSPVGPLCLVASGEHLVGVFFADHRRPWPMRETARRVPAPRNDGVLARATHQLEEFFAGQRQDFSLPLAYAVGTPFLHRVWDALTDIPFGDRTTYGALAARLGRPQAARAVGAAVGRNPLSLVVPCHRVLGGRGALTGFAGGLAVKAWLLTHEGRRDSAQTRTPPPSTMRDWPVT